MHQAIFSWPRLPQKIFSPVYFSHSFLPHHRQYIFKYLNTNTIKIPVLFDIANNIFNGI